MKNLVKFMLIFVFFPLGKMAFSQVQSDSTKLYRVEITDGNEYIGLMTAEDSLRIELDTKILGKVSIPRSEIKKITHIDPSTMKEGKLWFENPQSGRYFWSPNGYGLKKGEGYYQNIWVLWNQVSYGVTDYFSIGGGMIPLFFFGGTPTPVFIVPKFSIPVVKDKLNLGAGAIAGTFLGESNTGFALLYGIGTIGNRNNNLTFGLGYGYAGGSWASKPVITLSGMARIGPRGYMVTENYFIHVDTESLLILSLGGRSILKGSRSGIDYGLFFPINSSIGTFIAIPWLGFTMPFGN